MLQITLNRRAAVSALAAPMFAAVPLLSANRVRARDHGGTTHLAPYGQDPMVGVNPITGTTFVVWVGQEERSSSAATPADGAAAPANRILLARSADGGVTFEPPVVASGADGEVMSYVGSSPLVVFGPVGEVYVAYQRNVLEEGVGFGRDILRLVLSTDDGLTFAPAVDVFADTDALEAGTFHDALVGPDGTVYVAWLSYREYMPVNGVGDDAKTQVRVARSDDGGATFGPSVLVDNSSCECCRTALAITADDTLMLAWRDRDEQPDGGDPVRNMVVSRSTDRGETWDASNPIHDDGWRFAQCSESGPAIAVDGDGVLRAAWFTGKEDGPGVYYAASIDSGRTFSDPILLAGEDYFPHANVRGTLDSAGGFWVTWDDPRTEEGAIGLTRIAGDGVPEPALASPLAGRTSDVAVGPDGPIIAWVAGDAIEVAPLASLKEAS